MDLPDDAKALLGLPPSRFVAERNALAAALAARGDPAAAAVRKLPRPVGLAWVLNRLAREHRQDVDALAAAGDRLRRSQRRAVSGAGAGDFREAEEALRDLARRLRTAVEPLLAAEGRAVPAATLARLELLLRVAATGPARAALREGLLEREPAPGEELSGFAVLAGGGGTPAEPVRAAAPPAGRRKAPRRDAAREAREREERAREERERRERLRALGAAQRAAAAAARLVEREERAAAEAEERAVEARERARQARVKAEELRGKVRELEKDG